MYADITELDDDVWRVRANWKKWLSYGAAFAADMERLEKLFATGKYGPDWSFPRWLIVKCRISRATAYRMIHDLHKTLSEDQRTRIQDGIQAEREKKLALVTDRRAAQRCWDEWLREEKLRISLTQQAWDQWLGEEKLRKIEEKTAESKRERKRERDRLYRARIKKEKENTVLQIARQSVAESPKTVSPPETTYDWQARLSLVLDRLVEVLLTVPMPERAIAIEMIISRLSTIPGAPAPTRH